jgi:putative CocE/NonD family hydrolase
MKSALRFNLQVILLGLFLSVPVGLFAQASNFEVKREFGLRVPMRDGVTLSANVYLPDAPGQFPVILVRTPYDSGQPNYSAAGAYWASHGYVYVIEDVRGRGGSDGEFYPLVDDALDGDDSINWCAKQTWSTGKIGMLGPSYLGWVQGYAAGMHNPHLAALIPTVTPPDPYRNFPVQFGVMQMATASWLAFISGKTLQDINQFDLLKAETHLPVMDIDNELGRTMKPWRDYLAHPKYDAYWKKQDYQEKMLDSTTPALNVSGWYDDVFVGTTENYINMTTRAHTPEGRNLQWMLIGPWGHATNAGRVLGSIDFGPDAVIDFLGVELRWFDHWLKGIDNGVEKEPHVHIFVMGENAWHTEHEWPIARTKYVKYYLHSSGRGANSLFGTGTLSEKLPATEKEDHYRYDPNDPAPFITPADFHQTGGPDDYRSVERRDDVLVYTAAAVEQPTEVCGPLEVKLYAASSAPDTDWTVKILDVHPDGFAQRLNDGIVRARFRESMEKETLLTPGKVYEYEIGAWSTCVQLQKGHALRLEVSSSAFPKFARNLNTGGDDATGTKAVVAEQSIFHDAAHPSYALIPIVPAEK